MAAPHPTRLRNQHPPHRLRAVRLRSQRLLHCGQPSLQPCPFDVLERHPVHARRSPMLPAERIGVGQDVRSIHLVVEQVEAIGRFLLGLGVQRLLESPELRWSCQAHANLPPLDSSSRTPNQGAFPPRRFVVRQVQAVLCAPPTPIAASRLNPRSEGRDPSRRWASRVAPCSVPTCHAPYPGERSRRHWSVAPARSHGLPCNSGRSALTTSLSRPARASHVLRPVGLQTHPWWADVPRASASRSPSLLPR